MSYILVEAAESKNITITGRLGNKVRFEAVLQTADEENRNGRIYKKEFIEEALKDIKPTLKEGNFGGELDHPIPTSDETQTWVRHATYLYKEAAFKIEELYFKDNNLIGVCESLPTPNGNILASLIRDGVKVGFSARAIADNIQQQGHTEIVLPPITYISFDVVSNPSHKGAQLLKVNLESYNPKKLTESTKCFSGICKISEHLFRINQIPLRHFFGNCNIIL